MKKILLYDNTCQPVIAADHWRHIVDEHFDHEFFDPDRSYDRSRTLVCIPYQGAPEWALRMHEQGFKTVIDNLEEPRERYTVSQDYDRLDPCGVHEIQCDDFFWYNEHLWLAYLSDRGSWTQHRPCRTYRRLAWMPMRLARWHRDQIWQAMAPWRNEFYCSYVERGHTLPDDVRAQDHDIDQHYVNPLWIDDTWFTIAVETMIDEYDSRQWGAHHATMGYRGPWPFITEKTYKPIYMQHPFMVYGHSNTLTRLRELGFVTFDNLFDESYDVKHANKPEILVKNVAGFDRSAAGYDALTLEKIAHNHAWFFRRDVVQHGIRTGIIEPLMEYAEQA